MTLPSKCNSCVSNENTRGMAWHRWSPHLSPHSTQPIRPLGSQQANPTSLSLLLPAGCCCCRSRRCRACRKIPLGLTFPNLAAAAAAAAPARSAAQFSQVFRLPILLLLPRPSPPLQDLPDNLRSEEDQAVLALAGRKKWRQCPQCRNMVERSSGCNAMRCRCGERGRRVGRAGSSCPCWVPSQPRWGLPALPWCPCGLRCCHLRDVDSHAQLAL
jgi:hypothetical protein